MSVSYGGDSITFADGSVQSGGWTGMRNRIINGAMVIDQRNAGASVTPTSGAYTLDRWIFSLTQASKLTSQQNAGSVTPPAGFSNYLGVTSSSAYSVLTGDTFLFDQRIEGFNFADMAWGTASASTITLSFWVRSSLTGTFGGALINSASNRSYLFSYTISSANTWEQKSITIAGDTSGTWIGATNGIGVTLRFGLGSGSTYTGTAGSWQSANLVQPAGSVSVVGTSGATFYITGVQLERGSTASSFEYRPYGTELALCQRYFYQETYSGVNNLSYAAFAQNSTTALAFMHYPNPMRSTPTCTVIGATASNWNFSIGGSSDMVGNTISFGDVGIYSASLQLFPTSSSVSGGQAGRIRTSTTGYGISFSAEL